MLLALYDDAGCYYDHVIPPTDVPHDGAACTPNPIVQCAGKNPSTGKAPCLAFDFRRLGLRVPAMLLSPFVGKGAVFQRPRGPVKGKPHYLVSPLSVFLPSFTLLARTCLPRVQRPCMHNIMAVRLVLRIMIIIINAVPVLV